MMEKIATLTLLAILAVIVGYMARLGSRRRAGKASVAGTAPTTPPTTTPAPADKKKSWEWKKLEWLIPLSAWAIILVTFGLTFPDQFWSWAWRDHRELFLATNVAFLGIAILWYKEASVTGKKLATVTLILILTLAYGVHYQWFPKQLGAWDMQEVRKIFTLPTSVTEAFQPPVDHGVPWTQGTYEGKDGLLCVLKPGETSAVVPGGSTKLSFEVDSDVFLIVDGAEHFIRNNSHITPSEGAQMGYNGLGTRPKLRFKIPPYWDQEVPVYVVFQ